MNKVDSTSPTKVEQQEEAKVQSELQEVQVQDKVGTPYYLAPELWKDNPTYSKKSDIWALGCILYELCCFERPFPASEMDELQNKILNDKIQKMQLNVNKEF